MASDQTTSSEPTSEDMFNDESEMGQTIRHVLAQMAMWMIGFLLLAAVARLVLPPLADLNTAGTIAFIIVFAGFGIIPGMIIGLDRAERQTQGDA